MGAARIIQRLVWIGIYGVTLGAFVAGRPADAQELWRGAQLGMSPSDVRRLFPDAGSPPSVIALMGGETDDLVLPAVQLGTWSMEARFFFRDGALTAVQLAPNLPRVSRSKDNLRLAEQLADQLQRDYGAPYECGDKSFAGVAMFNCKWLKAPIVVRLWYMDVQGQAPNLRIGWRKADDPTGDF